MIPKKFATCFLLLTIAFIILADPNVSVEGSNLVSSSSVYIPVVFRNYDPTWQFLDTIKIELQPITLTTPYLIIDSSGRPHLFWDAGSNNAFIYHTYLTDQGWITPAPIAQTLGRSKLLTPPVAGNNNDIYIIWHNELNLGGPYRVLYAVWDGTQWGPEHELLEQGSSTYVNGMVRLDRQSIPTVAYLDSNGLFTGTTYYRQWTGNGFSPYQMIKTPIYTDSIWLDLDNGIRFYGDNGIDKVHFSYWKDGSFIENDKTFPGKISDRHHMLDGQNNLHLVRHSSVPVPGGNVSGIYHQCLKSDLTWDKELLLTEQENIQGYSLSFNDQMESILAWSKDNNQTIGVTFWNGCEITRQKELTLPVVSSSYGWGTFITGAQNAQSGKVCFLSKEKFASNSFLLTCTR